MAGGAIRSKLIHRESYRASVLHQLRPSSGGKYRPGDFCLDNAFALIEGHPASRRFYLEKRRYAQKYPHAKKNRDDNQNIGDLSEIQKLIMS
jgi:hypothetical protein